MTSKFANNFQFNKYGVVYYLEVNREGQPVQGQVPLTYQVYTGDGNETLAYDGSNVLVLDTDLSGGPLTIDFSAMNNWFGRSVQFIANTALLNDCTFDFGTGVIYQPPFAGSSNTKVFDATQTPLTTQLYFIDTTTAVMTNNPITDPSNIAAGPDNSVLTSFGGAVFWNVPNKIDFIKYGTVFTAQNLNAAAGPTALSFSTNPFANTSASTVGLVTGISQPSATQFTIGANGAYNVDITGYIDPASAGLGNSIVTLSLEVGGIEKTDYCIVCNGNYSFSGRFPSFAGAAGQNIRILARRVVGDKALTTFAAGLPAPSFASSILISSAS